MYSSGRVTGGATQAGVQAQTYTFFTTAGTLTAYTLTPTPAITAYTAGQKFSVRFHVASGAAPTLAISAIAAPPNLVKQDSTGAFVNIAPGDIPLNHVSDVVLLSAAQALVTDLPGATSLSGAGTLWTSQTTGAARNWQSVAYGNGLYVAVANNGVGGRVMTSPDGVTWTSRTSAADNAWDSIAYGSDLFVAVSYDGTGNRVMTSPDGITWTSRTSAADNQWVGLTYGNGLFVAVAQSGVGNRVMTSGRQGSFDPSTNNILQGGRTIRGDIVFDGTNTATVGAVTINKTSGRVNIAAAGTSVVVTNNLVTAASHVFAVMSSADATGRVTSVVPAAGSFTINTIAVTAQASFDFVVFNFS